MGRIIGIDLSKGGNCAMLMGGDPIVISGINGGGLVPSPIMIIKEKKEKDGIDGKVWSHEEQLGLYLLNIKKNAEKRLGETVSEAVISIPAHFSYEHCQSVYNAAKIAGINIKRFVMDTSAVALSLFKESLEQSILCVVLKESYLDIGVVNIGDGVFEEWAVGSCKLPVNHVEEIENMIKNSLKDSGLSGSELGEIIVCGEDDIITDISNLIKQVIPNKTIRLIPKDSIALGASVQAGKLDGSEGVGDILLLQLIPYELSIRTEGNDTTTIIGKYDYTIPTKKTKQISTSKDNQSEMEILVYADDLLSGRIKLDQIEHAKKGEPKIEVTIDSDANAIINAYVRNMKTNHSRHITLQAVNEIADEDAERSRAYLEGFLSGQMTRQEQGVIFEDGAKSVLNQLLPIIDNFDRAIDTA